MITMVFGTRINGAKLWIEIGGGQTVQLGEVAKILMVVFLAAYLRDKRELLAIPTQPGDGRAGAADGRPRAGAAVPGRLSRRWSSVLNDFGTALLFLGIFLAMIYLATGRVAYTALRPRGLPGRARRSSTPSCRASSRACNNWLHPFDDAAGPGLPARAVALRAGRRAG